MRKWFMLCLMLLFPVLLIAQDVVAVPVQTDEDFFKFLIGMIAQFKGASPYVIAGLIVELLIRLFNAPMFGKLFSKLEGHIKLTIVLSLSLIAGVITGLANGETWLSAIFNSTVLSAFLVLFNQVYKQYFNKTKV